jgi:hypothetical protein
MPGCQYIYRANALAYLDASSVRKKSFFYCAQRNNKKVFLVEHFQYGAYFHVYESRGTGAGGTVG